jgi:hypothetical protein
MAPYIAALVVLIVAILFAVYNRIDGFAIQDISVTESTTIQTLLDHAKRYMDLNKALKDKLDTGDSFDETLTESKAKELGLSYSKMADGSLYTEKPLSKAISSQLEMDITALTNILEALKKDLASGAIRTTTTLREFVKKNSPENLPEGQAMDLTFFNEILGNQVKSSNAREMYINKKLGGGKVAGIDTTDLYGAVGGVKEAIKSSTLETVTDLTKPKETNSSLQGAAPEKSIMMTKEVEDRIAKGVATQLKDSLLAQRSTQNIVQDTSCPYASFNSDATQQGAEYTQAKPNPGPDMSEYIRKDSIPCWNCSLP